MDGRSASIKDEWTVQTPSQLAFVTDELSHLPHRMPPLHLTRRLPDRQDYANPNGQHFGQPDPTLYLDLNQLMAWGLARAQWGPLQGVPFPARPQGLSQAMFPTAPDPAPGLPMELGPNHDFHHRLCILLGNGPISPVDVNTFLDPGYNRNLCHALLQEHGVLKDKRPRCPNHPNLIMQQHVRMDSKYPRTSKFQNSKRRRTRDHRIDFR